jgi:hypothetical protein
MDKLAVTVIKETNEKSLQDLVLEVQKRILQEESIYSVQVCTCFATKGFHFSEGKHHGRKHGWPGFAGVG